MRQGLLAALLVGSIVACASAGRSSPPDPQPPSAAEGVAVELDRFRIATQPGYLAFPDVARLRDGSLLLVYREGARHVDPGGRIAAQRGSPDGRLWSAPRVIVDAPGVDDRDPSVTALPDGEGLITFFRYRRQRDPGPMILHQVFAARSLGGGAIFGAATPMADDPLFVSRARVRDARWFDAAGRPIRVHACSSPARAYADRLVLPTYGGTTPDLRALSAAPRSTLSFWETSDLFHWIDTGWLLPPAPERWLQEPFLLPLRSGRLLVHARSAGADSPSSPGPLLQTQSEDGGRTWSPWRHFDRVGHAPYLLEHTSGVIVMAYRRVNDAYTFESVELVWSIDGGDTWTGPLPVDDCHTQDCGYPSLVELADGRLLLVYYDEQGRSINGVLYSVPSPAVRLP